MRKIVSRGLETSLAFDDVANASKICLQHISPCCYPESPNIFIAKIFVFNDEVMSLSETFPTDIWKSQAIQAKWKLL